MTLFSRTYIVADTGLTLSKLYNQDTFYDALDRDLRYARSLVVIESPFITKKRITRIIPALQRLQRRGIKIIVNTKPFSEREGDMVRQAIEGVETLQDIGIEVLMTVGHHRKLAIIDDILYEGSLNILSQNDSCEFMRRIQSGMLAEQMLDFIGIRKWL
jgi:hypothetical protein